MNKTLLLATLTLAATLGTTGAAQAQVAGSTTVGVSVTEATQIALGWSVKKSILGKTVYNDAGAKIGQVQDLIISPDRNVSYLIIGTGGFVGLGRHDVAVPVTQIREQGGRIVMPGATQDVLKAMPGFDYANDTARRDLFVTRAEQDIARATIRLGELQRESAAATSEAKAALDMQITGLQLDLKVAETRLTELKRASAKRWKEFETGMNAATARLRKWLDTAAAR